MRALDEKGMLIDVSHLSDRGFWDVCEETARPFVATHSDSRALCRNSRNLTDEQFAEFAKNIIDTQSMGVDAISGATIDSQAITGGLMTAFSHKTS